MTTRYVKSTDLYCDEYEKSINDIDVCSEWGNTEHINGFKSHKGRCSNCVCLTQQPMGKNISKKFPFKPTVFKDLDNLLNPLNF